VLTPNSMTISERANRELSRGDVLRNLDRLQGVEISSGERQLVPRTPATGVIGPLFKAARIALPARIEAGAVPFHNTGGARCLASPHRRLGHHLAERDGPGSAYVEIRRLQGGWGNTLEVEQSLAVEQQYAAASAVGLKRACSGGGGREAQTWRKVDLAVRRREVHELDLTAGRGYVHGQLVVAARRVRDRVIATADEDIVGCAMQHQCELLLFSWNVLWPSPVAVVMVPVPVSTLIVSCWLSAASDTTKLPLPNVKVWLLPDSAGSVAEDCARKY
jgi:hypothetical protein